MLKQFLELKVMMDNKDYDMNEEERMLVEEKLSQLSIQYNEIMEKFISDDEEGEQQKENIFNNTMTTEDVYEMKRINLSTTTNDEEEEDEEVNTLVKEFNALETQKDENIKAKNERKIPMKMHQRNNKTPSSRITNKSENNTAKIYN